MRISPLRFLGRSVVPDQLRGAARFSPGHRCLHAVWLSLALALAMACARIEQPAPSAAQPPPAPERFQFGVMADLPYTEENERMLPALMGDMDQASLAFVIHLGDFTRTRCGDDLFAQRLAEFGAMRHPLIFVPGDNDWTDCHQASDGSYEPTERLATLRHMFFAGNASLGQRTITLTRQSEQPGYEAYRENVRWTYQGIRFIAINQPGSNNNLGRSDEMDLEYAERNAANLRWMRESFALARSEGARGLVMLAHSNPGFEVDAPARGGYNDFLEQLTEETLQFPGQVVFVHADTHYFRVDRPMVAPISGRRVEHFTRVEAFGAPDSHWVRVEVDASNPNLVTVQPAIVGANLIDHSQPDAGGFATRNGTFTPARSR